MENWQFIKVTKNWKKKKKIWNKKHWKIFDFNRIVATGI